MASKDKVASIQSARLKRAASALKSSFGRRLEDLRCAVEPANQALALHGVDWRLLAVELLIIAAYLAWTPSGWTLAHLELIYLVVAVVSFAVYFTSLYIDKRNDRELVWLYVSYTTALTLFLMHKVIRGLVEEPGTLYVLAIAAYSILSPLLLLHATARPGDSPSLKLAKLSSVMSYSALFTAFWLAVATIAYVINNLSFHIDAPNLAIITKLLLIFYFLLCAFRYRFTRAGFQDFSKLVGVSLIAISTFVALSLHSQSSSVADIAFEAFSYALFPAMLAYSRFINLHLRSRRAYYWSILFLFTWLNAGLAYYLGATWDISFLNTAPVLMIGLAGSLASIFSVYYKR